MAPRGFDIEVHQAPVVFAALIELFVTVADADDALLPGDVVDAWCVCDALLGEHLQPVYVVDP